MKLTFSRNDLSEMCDKCMPIIPTRTTMDQLKFLFFQIEKDGCFVTVSNSEITLKVRVPISSWDKTGEFLIDGAKMRSVVKATSSDEIKLTVKDDHILINTGGSRHKVSMSTHTFPFRVGEANVQNTVKVNPVDLQAGLELGIFFQDQPTGAYIHGVSITNDNGLVLDSTDGHHMTRYTVGILHSEGDPVTSVISVDSCKHAIKNLSYTEEDVIVDIGSNHVVFRDSDFTLECIQVEGRMISFRRPLSRLDHGKWGKVDCKKLSNQIRETSVFTNKEKDVLDIKFEGNRVTLLHESQEGKSETNGEYDIDFNGECSLSSPMLKSFMRAIAGIESIEICYVDKMSPIFFKHNNLLHAMIGLSGG